MGSILIVKGKRGKMIAKIRQRANKAHTPDDYVKVINTGDYNDLALLFEDLDVMFGIPIERAFSKYKEKKEKGFPFF